MLIEIARGVIMYTIPTQGALGRVQDFHQSSIWSPSGSVSATLVHTWATLTPIGVTLKSLGGSFGAKKSRIRREWRRRHARSPQPAHKSSNGNRWGPQSRPVKFRKKSFQNICVLLSKVVRDTLRPERKRSDDDYSL